MKKSLIFVTLTLFVSFFIWLLVFLGSEYWKVSFIPRSTPLFIIGITIFCFLLYFWRGLDDIHFLIKALISSILTTITAIIWFTVCKITFIIISGELSIPRGTFAKSVKPFTDLSHSIGKSDLFGFFFALIFLIGVGTWWSTVLFGKGAEEWRDSMIKWDKFLGKKTNDNDFFLKLPVLKICSTFFLIFAVIAFYASIIQIIKG